MKSSSEFEFNGQRYLCIGHRHHETRDGRWLELVVLESDCPDCGATFHLLATKTNARRRMLTRRCAECRRPGVPVEPRRRRVVAKWVTSRIIRSAKSRRRRTASKDQGLVGLKMVVEAPALARRAPAPAAVATGASVEITDTYLRALNMLDG